MLSGSGGGGEAVESWADARARRDAHRMSLVGGATAGEPTLRLPRCRAGLETVGTLRVDDVRSRIDGAWTSKLLLEAAKRLAMWDPSRQRAGADVRAGARLVAEAEQALARFRRLDELQKLLVEVTALRRAGWRTISRSSLGPLRRT